jgi:hypothetical protein
MGCLDVKKLEAKKLLVFVLFIGCASYVGVAQSTAKVPLSPDAKAMSPGHLEIPKNCQQTLEPDGSVLVTCECEQCGQVEATDGIDPLPWACVSEQGALHCGYAETEAYETGARKKSKI